MSHANGNATENAAVNAAGSRQEPALCDARAGARLKASAVLEDGYDAIHHHDVETLQPSNQEDLHEQNSTC